MSVGYRTRGRGVGALALAGSLALAVGARAQEAPALYYEEDGSGPAVVLIPEWAHDTGSWFRILPSLRPGHRLVRYDLRGQGRSRPPADGDYSLAAHREDLGRVVDRLGVERVHLVGAGLGGAIALSFTDVHPDRVASVTVLNPRTVTSPEERGWWARLAEAWERIGGPTLADYSSVLVERWFGTPFAVRQPWIVPYYDLMLRRQDSAALVASFRVWAVAEARPSARHRLPALLLRGERARDPAADAIVHAALPSVERVVLPGVGWVPQLEAPDEIGPRLAEFLRNAAPDDGVYEGATGERRER